MKQVNQVKKSEAFLKDEAHRVSHDKNLWAARMRRDKAAWEITEWEELRDYASIVKRHTLSNLDHYLIEFEKNATDNGIKVHWARDAKEYNEIVYQLFQEHNVKTVTKSKSALTDECGLREFMAEKGIEIYESDLGERIQQLDGEPDSHLVLPAIHKLRSDVAQIFADKLGSDVNNDDPHYLNKVMRNDMRPRYFKADAGMSGVNFAVAETGGIIITTNEGNADICANVTPLYIASMGIEKVIPRMSDAALFVRLLSRSALGYNITQYTSHYHGPREGQEMHIIIVDNGRSEKLANQDFWEILKCLHCGTCMNTCPVFRRCGGLSYGATYMGPIGIVYQPAVDLHGYAQLPYACTHCGSCYNVCPVRLPIPQYVMKWRDTLVSKREDLLSHRLEMSLAGMVLKNSRNLETGIKFALGALRHWPERILESKENQWAVHHNNPEPPEETCRQWFELVATTRQPLW